MRSQKAWATILRKEYVSSINQDLATYAQSAVRKNNCFIHKYVHMLLKFI